jgi:DNA-binding beta-propeller fold protein YncE
MKPDPRSLALALTIALAACGGSSAAPSAAAPAPNGAPKSDGLYPLEGGALRYRAAIRFGEELENKRPSNAMPAGWKFGRVSAVSTDAQGNVYVAHRGTDADPIVVFDRAGTKMVRSWGKGLFTTIHGLRVDPDGNIWVTDTGDHRVWKFSAEGKVLLQLGAKGQAGSTRDRFTAPADVAFAPNGEVLIVEQGEVEMSAGLGHSRVVRLSRDGAYLGEIGGPGAGPAQFHFAHGIAVDSRGRIYVGDRENNRIQIFDPGGRLLKEWTHLGSPLSIVVGPGDALWVLAGDNALEILTYDSLSGRVMRVDPESGRILGSMVTPGHMLSLSPSGDLYVASITGNVFRFFEGWMAVQNGGTVPIP